jgi:hypothetical protein
LVGRVVPNPEKALLNLSAAFRGSQTNLVRVVPNPQKALLSAAFCGLLRATSEQWSHSAHVESKACLTSEFSGRRTHLPALTSEQRFHWFRSSGEQGLVIHDDSQLGVKSRGSKKPTPPRLSAEVQHHPWKLSLASCPTYKRFKQHLG